MDDHEDSVGAEGGAIMKIQWVLSKYSDVSDQMKIQWVPSVPHHENSVGAVKQVPS